MKGTITEAQAREGGYVAVTDRFFLPSDQRLAKKMFADFKGCRVVWVRFSNGVEIWRHRDELRSPGQTEARVFSAKAVGKKVGRKPKRW